MVDQVKGSLSGEYGIKNLDKILNAFISSESDFYDGITELSSFFCEHLKTGMLPFCESKSYPSKVQMQVYQWIDSRYKKFVSFLETAVYPVNNVCISAIRDMYLCDSSKLLAKSLGKCYITSQDLNFGEEMLSDICFHDSVYSLLTSGPQNFVELCIKLLKSPLPNGLPSSVFTDFFFAVIKVELPEDKRIEILSHFHNVLDNVDDKLIVYRYLEELMTQGPILASLAIPYLVDVAIKRGVDVSQFYEQCYAALSPESLSLSGRKRFLDTLSRVLSPKSIPVNTQTAFAVKLSRILLLVSPDAQLDILGILQYLAAAHQSVMKLLEPLDTPVSNILGKIEDCSPQTLWEVRTLRSSPIPAISEAARALGQRRVPADFESFDLRSVIQSIHPKGQLDLSTANWPGKLDRALWI